MFDAVAVGLYETPSGTDSHLTAWAGEAEWGNETAWEHFRNDCFAPSSEPFVYLTRSENSETFRDLPASTEAVVLISIPGRSHIQGTLIVILEKRIDPISGFAKNIQTIRSIIGSSIERSSAEQKMRVAQRMETVGRLAGTIAHDFNNLLTTIMGCSQLLAEDKDRDDDEHELLSDISRAADHAALLTRQLLVLSRKQVVLVSPVDINQASQGFCHMADRMVGEEITVEFQSLDTPAYVLADPSNIEQILLNLTVNARDAMPEGGRIRLSLDRCHASDKRLPSDKLSDRNGFIVLSFSDTGSGMSPHVLSHLFEPFFTTKRSGTGLGLASVQEIVNSLGGQIQVSSDPKSGTTFLIFIPEEEVIVKDSKNRTDVLAPLSSSGTGERVLLVDDNDHVRRTLSRVLNTAGFSVTVAHSGIDALRILEESETPFDLILTDIIMPALSGIDLASRLRERADPTPILFMSGFADSNQREIGMLGSFIAKPFTSCQLITRIGLILSGGASLAESGRSNVSHPGQAGPRPPSFI
jgi:signal transduction histidine kinase/CheY-like chemotaxis protein